jgi:radical SAM superfamily enzyme YgiQ (UPF0313 family)
MKLLIVIPESPFLTNPIAFPPFGALYVASSAESIGTEVRVIDLSYQGLPNWEPDFIGISASTPHLTSIRKLMAQLKEYEAPIIVGGPHFDIVPHDYLRIGASSCSRGDGEETIIKFMNGERGIIDGELSDCWWPMPARHLIDIKRYEYTLGGVPTTSMITSRGCPFECCYCCKTTLGKSVRVNPIDKVREEVQEIKGIGFGGIMFYDDELNLIPNRLDELCGVMKEENIIWRGFIRTNLFTDEQARIMKDSNCYELCAGVESGSDEILNNVNKRATIEDATRCRKICKDNGIRFKAFMIIGLPGETEETVKQTEEWLLTERPDDFDLCPFTPYPGSPIMDDPEKYGIQILHDYWRSSYYHKGMPGSYQSHVSTTGLSAYRVSELRNEIEQRVRSELLLL